MTRRIAVDVVDAVEHGLAHRVQRVLDRLAVVLGEGLEQRLANALPARTEVDVRRRGSARSRSARSRGGDRVVSGSVVNSSRGKPANADCEDFRITSRRRRRRSIVRSRSRLHGRGAHVRAACARTPGRARDRRSAMRPQRCSVRSTRDASQSRIALEEMPGERRPNALGLADRLARRQRVHGVLHRVGRQHVAVVAVACRMSS